MGYNKIIYGGTTLVDLTGDTVAEGKLLKDITAHDKSGEVITGTCTFDSDTSDATATVDEVLSGQTAYARGTKLTGTMPNRGGFDGIISEKDEVVSIQNGYHDGSGSVSISSVEQAKIIPENIKQGVSILGVTGTSRPSSDIKVSQKTVTPTTSQQTILPTAGTDYLSQVIVNKIPYVESSNSAGGTTVTIG